MRGRDAVRDPGVTDLALGPDQALRHRRLRHQERPGDLGGRETCQRAQRQRDLSVDCECRVTTREDQPETVIGDAAVVARVGAR